MLRKMLFFERLMYVDGVTPVNCVLTARVRGLIDAGNLRTALRKVQARHPLLRTRVIEKDGEPCFVWDEDANEIPAQTIKRTSDNQWQDITVTEWQRPFDGNIGPLIRILWIQSSEVSELTLVAHHCICDGSSLITLIREILEITDQPDTELIPYSSYNSLADLIPDEVLSDVKAIRRIKKKAIIYKLFLALAGTNKKKSLVNGRPYILLSRVDVEQFAAILHRSKAEGTTPYAALCVAFLLAFREVLGAAAKNKIMCPVNIRRYLSVIKSDTMFAFAPTIELSLDKRWANDFWVSARQMKQSIGEKIEHVSIYEDLMLGERMRSWVPRIVNFLQSSRGGHDVAFSNVGELRVRSLYRSFALETITGTSVAVPWRNANTLVMSSFLGQLELGFISNDQFLPELDAAAIQERAFQILTIAMGQPVAASAF